MTLVKPFQDGLYLIIFLLGLLFIIERFEFQINRNYSQEENIQNNITKHIDNEKEAHKQKIKTLADVLWCENRQSKESMKLVLSVIYNRAKEKTLNGLYEEVIKPYQFTCLNSEEIISSQLKRKKDIEMYKTAEQLIYKFLNGKFNPLTNATFYYNPEVVGYKPKYLEDKPLLLSFENHDFY